MPTKPNSEETLFAAARKLPATARAAFLDRECAGDAGLRREVESLLAAHEKAGDSLDGAPTVLAMATTKRKRYENR